MEIEERLSEIVKQPCARELENSEKITSCKATRLYENNVSMRLECCRLRSTYKMCKMHLPEVSTYDPILVVAVLGL